VKRKTPEVTDSGQIVRPVRDVLFSESRKEAAKVMERLIPVGANEPVTRADVDALSARYASAVRTLQDIAGTFGKAYPRSLARDRLIQLGEPVKPEGM
jgi:hypothetical protein